MICLQCLSSSGTRRQCHFSCSFFFLWFRCDQYSFSPNLMSSVSHQKLSTFSITIFVYHSKYISKINISIFIIFQERFLCSSLSRLWFIGPASGVSTLIWMMSHLHTLYQCMNQRFLVLVECWRWGFLFIMPLWQSLVITKSQKRM